MSKSENQVNELSGNLADAAQPPEYEKEMSTMMDAFQVTDASMFLSKVRGKQIPIQVLGETPFPELVPKLDKDFVISPELIKNVAVGIGMNIPVYLHGYHGTGKSSVLKLFAAATNRPYLRVQHTGNTEESDLLGQVLAKDGATYFSPGPLALAMRFGWMFNADEYDMADPSILSVYQPVLEGEPLYIKEATPEWRMVQPHPDFRIVATGNTNGTGDETGLYQGTSMGNAANYSRFGIVDNVKYMEAKAEIEILKRKVGLDADDAKDLVNFAGTIRNAFAESKMSTTIGQRELINAARVGIGKVSWVEGLQLSFVNRLNRQDEVTATNLISTIFDDKSASSKSKMRKVA